MRDKKAKLWLKVRKEIIADFERRGITSCELRWDGCWVNNGLTLAHRMKRRKIQDEKELSTVANLCIICHNKVEILPYEEMFQIITEIINNRNV